MCYHVSTPGKKKIKQSFPGLDITSDLDKQDHPHLSGFTNPVLPAILSTNTNLVQPLVWGFLPEWADREGQEKEGMLKGLNTRDDALFVSTQWKPFARQRCLFLVDGFYEHQHRGKDKVPHYIYLADRSIFALAGIWRNSRLKGMGGSIVTSDTNELLSKLHNSADRAPLIIPPNQWDSWLNPDLSEKEVLLMAKPYIATAMAFHEVSSNLTAHGKNTDVELTRKEVEKKIQGDLFG